MHILDIVIGHSMGLSMTYNPRIRIPTDRIAFKVHIHHLCRVLSHQVHHRTIIMLYIFFLDLDVVFINQPHAKLYMCPNSLPQKKNPNKQTDRWKKAKGGVTEEVWVYKTHTAVQDSVGMIYNHRLWTYCPQAIQLNTSRSDHAWSSVQSLGSELRPLSTRKWALSAKFICSRKNTGDSGFSVPKTYPNGTQC